MIVRSVVSVVVGYAIFAISAVLLFQASGVDPHGTGVSSGFRVFAIGYGAVFALVAGLVTTRLAGRAGRPATLGLAAVIAVVSIVSLITVAGSSWTQLVALFVYAPLAYVGGYLVSRDAT